MCSCTGLQCGVVGGGLAFLTLQYSEVLYMYSFYIVPTVSYSFIQKLLQYNRWYCTNIQLKHI